MAREIVGHEIAKTIPTAAPPPLPPRNP
ncbi:uncharacterized protein METZ01_LOCUS50654 [marine metagenome]|uniref:Uncharacterized protein n=1 Tax=marine metagenome TaxID=408172 RepID=A0A381S170_9ZZZZ